MLYTALFILIEFAWSGYKGFQTVFEYLFYQDTCYEPHGIVSTVHLRVIENAKLRELVAEGPKYGELKSYRNNVFEIHLSLCKKFGLKQKKVELKYLSEQKYQLKESVADPVSNLKEHFEKVICKGF